MTRDQYLRLLTEGYRLAFEEGALEAGAERYAAAFESLASGEFGHPDHHGEFAAVLEKLNRPAQALAEHRRALDAARLWSRGDLESPDVAIAAYFLGEHLLRLGQASDVLDVIRVSEPPPGNLRARLLALKAEALGAVGRLPEAQRCAREAEATATDAIRATLRERLSLLLDGT